MSQDKRGLFSIKDDETENKNDLSGLTHQDPDRSS
jgi:hypothetical protein